MILLKKHFGMLGLKVEDRVTGFRGIVASVSFDLYGCIQGLVNPGMGKDGKLGEQLWFDMNRLEVVKKEPIMPPPDFDYGPIAEGKKGPAEKPSLKV